MAKQHPIPKYVIHELNKAKIQKPPRIPSKEISIFIYQTNQTLRAINETDKKTIVNLQSQLKQELKFNPTFLPIELSTPRFENPADTGYWLTQIKGFIYEQLNIDPKYYSYFTLVQDTKETIQLSAKFRIVRNSEVVSGHQFMYSEILAVTESIKSFPGLDKAEWELVKDIKVHDPISKIKIEIENNAQFFPNGIQIFTKKNLTDVKATRNNIKQVLDMAPENRCLTYINILNTNPLLTNYASWQYFWDKRRHDYDKFKDLISLVYARASEPGQIVWKNIHNNYQLKLGVKGWFWTYELFIPELDYFTSDRKNIYQYQEGEYQGNEYTWLKDLDFVRDFLNNEAFNDERQYPELDDKWVPKANIIPLEEKNITKDEDLKYFVLGKNINLKENIKLLEAVPGQSFDQGSYFQIKNPNQEFNRLNSNRWKELITPDDISLTIDLERVEFSPRIELRQKEATWVKFSLYNDKNELITSTTFSTNNNFYDGDFVSIFQF